MQWLLDHLAKEWAVINQAPIAFLLCLLIGAAAAWWFAKQRFTDRMDLLERRIEDYKERLGLVVPDRTAYSKLTNAELRQAVREFVPKVREYSARIKNEALQQMMSRHRQITQAKSDNERMAIHNTDTTEYMQMSYNHQNEFDQTFKAQAVVFRDEMLRRLPKQQEDRTGVNIMYEHLAGPSPVEDIASDLEQLSMLLPQR